MTNDKEIDTYLLFEQIMTFDWIRCNRNEARALLMKRIIYNGFVYTLNKIHSLGAGVYEIRKEDLNKGR